MPGTEIALDPELVASVSDFRDITQFVYTVKEHQASSSTASSSSSPTSLPELSIDAAEHRFSTAQGFQCVHEDPVHRIQMFTKLLDVSPIQMMKATAVMPCTPAQFLRYLDLDVRRLWDAVFIEGTIVGELPKVQSPSTSASASTSSAGPQPAAGATSTSVTGAAAPSPPSTGQSSSSSSSSSSGVRSRKIQLKHIAFRSPIPILLNRDFELVVCEQVHHDGSAILKAISPPRIGTFLPQRREYVRGVVNTSGFVAEPFVYKDEKGNTVQGSRICYIALVHPMGLVPTFFVNAVIGKQTNGLLQLLRFMQQHPLDQLVEKGLIEKIQPQVGCVVVRKKSSLLSKL